MVIVVMILVVLGIVECISMCQMASDADEKWERLMKQEMKKYEN